MKFKHGGNTSRKHPHWPCRPSDEWSSIYSLTSDIFISKINRQEAKPCGVSLSKEPLCHGAYLVSVIHDDVIKWKHFPRYWPFVRGIHRSPVNSPHKGQWRGALMPSLICARINGWVNNREAGDLRRHQAHCDVIVMWSASVHQRWSVNMYPCPTQGWI